MKVAIVCDWLTGIGGAERVVLELHNMYPDAPIFTSQYDPKKISWFKNADVRTGWLQKLPIGLKKFLPVLRAIYFSRLDLSDYDLVISSSGAEAKAVKTPAHTTHISYCHAPTHYYWSRYDAYLNNPGFPRGFNWIARIALKILVGPLRSWDKRAAGRPNIIIANSSHIQSEIKRYYNRDAVVIHPPVDIARFTVRQSTPRVGFVIAGRHTPYKRIDLAVQACNELSLPLTVIGDGPQHDYLMGIAGPTIKFVGEIDDDLVPQYFAGARGFIFPGLDDFGITPVEAMAAGTPVVAYKAGGATDYVVEGKTGLFFSEQSVKSLITALQSFELASFDNKAIAHHAESFSVAVFRKRMRDFIAKTMDTKR